MAFDTDEFWAKLDEKGADGVRLALQQELYGLNTKKRAFVVEWLRRKDQERIDFSNRAQMNIARSAKNAAWTAAIAAIIAAISAIIAIALSF